MVSSYTANLAAFLVVENLESPVKDIDSFNDCFNEKNECPADFGAKAGGSTLNFFKVRILFVNLQFLIG